MGYKLAFLLVAAFLFQASFSMADDALAIFTKQAAEDIPVYKAAHELKVKVLKTLDKVKEKADQLLQKRQANQNDPALQSELVTLTEELLALAKDYLPAETKSLDAANSHVHMVVNMFESLKKGA